MRIKLYVWSTELEHGKNLNNWGDDGEGGGDRGAEGRGNEDEERREEEDGRKTAILLVVW